MEFHLEPQLETTGSAAEENKNCSAHVLYILAMRGIRCTCSRIEGNKQESDGERCLYGSLREQSGSIREPFT